MTARIFCNMARRAFDGMVRLVGRVTGV